MPVIKARCNYDISDVPEQKLSAQQPVDRGSTGDKGSHDVVMSVVKHLRKPQSELFSFDGDPLSYKRFMRQFQTRVIINSENDDERFNYLEQFTSGEAHRIVKGYGYLDSTVGYQAALRELEDRYGDNELIASSFIKKALKWPCVKPNDSKSLDELAIFLSECENAVRSIDSMKILEYPDNMRKIVSKLPLYMHDRWRNVVQRAKEDFMQVKFHDLVLFIKREAKKSLDPIYGREAMLSVESQMPSGRGVSVKPKHSFAGVKKPSDTHEVHNKSDRNNVPAVGNAFQTPCVYCRDKTHCMEFCRVLKSLMFRDRIQFLRSKGFM